MSLEGPQFDDVTLSVVMPCLDEAETLSICIAAAKRGIAETGLSGEIIIADNGSADGSPTIAERLGARVVHVEKRGYGNALRGGIAAARGEFVVMGDADASYDFAAIPQFVDKLSEEYDLVMGCRLPAGGGSIASGAMPPLHRFFGNPVFTLISRVWFKVPIHDMYCGLRGFRKDFYETLNQRCTGMEFANEMVIQAIFKQGRIAEVPITLHPDGRTLHGPHLRTFRDGWRTLRFLLMYCPRWLFLVPGGLLILFGLVGYLIAYPGITIGGIHFEINSLLVASLSILVGFQLVLFAVFTKVFGIAEGFLPEEPAWKKAFSYVTLETGIVVGLVLAIVGCVAIGIAVNEWRAVGFGDLDSAIALRWVIPGTTMVALGVQTIFGSFFMSILGLKQP